MTPRNCYRPITCIAALFCMREITEWFKGRDRLLLCKEVDSSMMASPVASQETQPTGPPAPKPTVSGLR